MTAGKSFSNKKKKPNKDRMTMIKPMVAPRKQTHGYFDDERKEYVITNPNTPRPWCNYLYNERYCLVISQTAGGYSFLQDCKVQRITRWDGKRMMYNRPGHYFFLRDRERREYWSATGDPWGRAEDGYLCRHGLGYTQIENSRDGISSSILYFVPQDDDLEVWKIQVRNDSGVERRLQGFAYVEFLLGDRDMDVILPAIDCLYKKCGWHEELGGIFAQAFGAKKIENSFNAFFAGNFSVQGFDGRAESFAGRYSNLERSPVLECGKCTNSSALGEDIVGVLQHDFDLKPGESKEMVVVLGPCRSPEKAKGLIEKYRDPKVVDRELQRVEAFWKNVVDLCVVKTPDENFDRFVNVWLKYQLYASNYWSRSSSFYHEGEGGRGYRDSSQDSEGMVLLNSEYAKEKIRKLAFYQFSNGQPAAGWSEVRGVYRELPFKDHPIWMPFTLLAYVNETGDADFLNEEIPFHDGGAPATLYEHCKRALNFLFEDRGKRGFPHFGQNNHADWNDAFDALTGDAESVWLAMGLCRSLKAMMELAGIIDDREYIPRMKERYEELSELLNSVGWDGEWYLRGFDNKGQVVGSRTCEEGQIFLNSQSWAILSGIASPERANQVMKKVDLLLDSEIGPALFAPAYTKFNPELGRISLFAPGTKENAAVFCHAAIFKIVADCMIGRGNQAHDSFTKITPNIYASESYKAEPYVFAEYLVGPSSPDRPGEGAFTWLTGTATWMFISATQWILGARPTFKGLMLDPCLPAAWDRCSIKRRFRGAEYRIEIENPEGVQKGVKSITVNGQAIEGQILPLPVPGQSYQVNVVMGR